MSSLSLTEVLRIKDSLYSFSAKISIKSKLLSTLFPTIAVTTNLFNNFLNLSRRMFSWTT
ncbi:uncharacterized protein K441DRAFT_739918 [Cenococcum geophilum 1.58]|uniref:Uncharacterized protein n=1 Tax=Cenococcum geophilum 1.58 TaxID=794803 RepID=A0ACC8ENQ0_9PEZI|nr:hypothetical protein K441DRAFT_739918 [Cenococcum geophilum 1.58]